jgi:hypothetical protein
MRVGSWCGKMHGAGVRSGTAALAWIGNTGGTTGTTPG